MTDAQIMQLKRIDNEFENDGNYDDDDDEKFVKGNTEDFHFFFFFDRWPERGGRVIRGPEVRDLQGLVVRDVPSVTLTL